MSFRKLPNDGGLLYEPETAGGKRKNRCRECFACQWCSDERCSACLTTSADRPEAGDEKAASQERTSPGEHT